MVNTTLVNSNFITFKTEIVSNAKLALRYTSSAINFSHSNQSVKSTGFKNFSHNLFCNVIYYTLSVRGKSEYFQSAAPKKCATVQQRKVCMCMCKKRLMNHLMCKSN